jgi:hypothetical protein
MSQQHRNEEPDDWGSLGHTGPEIGLFFFFFIIQLLALVLLQLGD